MMGIRIVCFILMVVITPYGWYTWVLGAAAIFLPYIAVVLREREPERATDGCAESPERALPATPDARRRRPPSSRHRAHRGDPRDRGARAGRRTSEA